MSEASGVRGLYKRGRTWWISYSTPSGRRRESTGTSSKKLAMMILQDRRLQVLKGTLGIRGSSRMTLHSLLYDRYLPWASSAKAPKTYERDKGLAKRLCEEFGDRPAAGITVEDLEAYRHKRRDAGARPATVNREIGMLRHAYNKAVEWGLLRDNPAAKIKPFKEHSRLRFLTRDEQDRLLLACSESTQRLLLPLVSIGLLTGLRAGELRALEWRDIDLRRRILTVRSGKGDTDRSVPLCDQAVEVLTRMKHKGDRLFPIGSWKRSFATALRKAKITDFKFHDLRRTFATNLSSAGVDLVTIKRVLGHSQFSATLVYLGTSEERMLDAVSRLPELRTQGSVIQEDTDVRPVSKRAQIGHN